jgi:sialic acid synthase SpsE
MYIISEIGVNHENNLNLAKKMIRDAAHSGTNAVKFQFYKAKNLAVNKENTSYWDIKKETTTNQYELFKKHDKFGIEEYIELKKVADECNVDFILTCFDFESLELAHKHLDLKIYKIASADITHLLLIEKTAKYAKTIILSCGGANEDEIRQALSTIQNVSNAKIILLHCILNYPCSLENLNLKRIKILKDKFSYLGVDVGYSDHSTFDTITLFNACLLGAKVIEKHFTYDKTQPGNDHYHAMDSKDLLSFTNFIFIFYRQEYQFSNLIYNLGPLIYDTSNNNLGYLACENIARKYARRSIIINKDLKKGSILTINDIDFKRPCFGIPANFYKNVLSKKINRDMKKETFLNYVDLEEIYDKL